MATFCGWVLGFVAGYLTIGAVGALLVPNSILATMGVRRWATIWLWLPMFFIP